jgi:hypothetical protein
MAGLSLFSKQNIEPEQNAFEFEAHTLSQLLSNTN